MGAFGYGYKSKLLFENKKDDFESYENDLPEISYTLDGEIDIRGDSLHHTLLFKTRQGQNIIELHYVFDEEEIIYFVVYNLETRTRSIYRTPNDVDQFTPSICRRLGIEPTKEEIDKDKPIDIPEDDLPF